MSKLMKRMKHTGPVENRDMMRLDGQIEGIAGILEQLDEIALDLQAAIREAKQDSPSKAKATALFESSERLGEALLSFSRALEESGEPLLLEAAFEDFLSLLDLFESSYEAFLTELTKLERLGECAA